MIEEETAAAVPAELLRNLSRFFEIWPALTEAAAGASAPGSQVVKTFMGVGLMRGKTNLVAALAFRKPRTIRVR